MKMSIKINVALVWYTLFSIFFAINIGIGAYFVYYKHLNHNNKENVSVCDYVYHAKNY